MGIDDVRDFEKRMQEETNQKVGNGVESSFHLLMLIICVVFV